MIYIYIMGRKAEYIRVHCIVMRVVKLIHSLLYHRGVLVGLDDG